MAFDTFLKIDGVPGESTDDKHKDWIEVSRTTIQLGENSLSQVAGRLGIDHKTLLAANPQIKDPSSLKVGQEIHLPTHPTPKNESSVATPPVTVHAKDLPKPPLGDPLAASMVKESLLASKSTAQNLDQVIGAVTLNTTLGQVDVAIRDLLNEIQNKKGNEEEIKDAAKNSGESGDAQLQEAAQKAAQSFEQLNGAVTIDGTVTGNTGGASRQGTTAANGESKSNATRAVFPDRILG